MQSASLLSYPLALFHRDGEQLLRDVNQIIQFSEVIFHLSCSTAFNIKRIYFMCVKAEAKQVLNNVRLCSGGPKWIVETELKEWRYN